MEPTFSQPQPGTTPSSPVFTQPSVTPPTPIETAPRMPMELPEPPRSGWSVLATFVLFVLIIAGGFYAWRMLNNVPEDKVVKEETNTQTVTPAPADILGDRIETTAMPTIDQWPTVGLSVQGHSFSIKIPIGFHAVIQDGGNAYVTIVADDTTDETQPVMIINIFPRMTIARAKPLIVKQTLSGNIIWSEIAINGLNGQMLNLDNKAFPQVNMAYLLQDNRDVIAITLFENTPWEYFDQVAQSIKISK